MIDFYKKTHNIMVEEVLLEKHTHENALCAYEVESVMECGDYGGLQRWQLTIIHLSLGERKLYFMNFKTLHFGKFFYLQEKHMDKIYECAANQVLVIDLIPSSQR